MIMANLIDNIRLSDGKSVPGYASRINGHFVKGPIPLSWLSIAAALPGKSIHAGLACWYQLGLKKCSPFPMSNTVAGKFGMDKDSKARSLRNLENAGLIRCYRTIGRSVTVEILYKDS